MNNNYKDDAPGVCAGAARMAAEMTMACRRLDAYAEFRMDDDGVRFYFNRRCRSEISESACSAEPDGVWLASVRAIYDKWRPRIRAKVAELDAPAGKGGAQ